MLWDDSPAVREQLWIVEKYEARLAEFRDQLADVDQAIRLEQEIEIMTKSGLAPLESRANIVKWEKNPSLFRSEYLFPMIRVFEKYTLATWTYIENLKRKSAKSALLNTHPRREF